MKTRLFLLLAAALCWTGLARAETVDVSGSWHAQFDTEIGQQTYTYHFAREGDAVTGKADYKNAFNSGTVALKDLKIDGDRIFFREELDFDGMKVTITYQGAIADDKMTLSRQVMDIATEHLVAQRVKAAAE